MKRTMSATKARVHFGELMRWVVERQKPVIVERRGQPHVVVLSITEYEQLQTAQQQSWRQTLERAHQVSARIKARRDNQPLTPPAEIIHQVRKERDTKLADLQ